MNSQLERRSTTPVEVQATDWVFQSESTYECRVLICEEADGGYSATALRLPGVVSEGETVEEAIEGIRDAFQAAVQVYLEDGGAIPWQEPTGERPAGAIERWVLVNV